MILEISIVAFLLVLILWLATSIPVDMSKKCNHFIAYAILDTVQANGGSGVQCSCGEFIT